MNTHDVEIEPLLPFQSSTSSQDGPLRRTVEYSMGENAVRRVEPVPKLS